MSSHPAPSLDLARVADAQERMERVISNLTNDDMAKPSALAGWTVGHVLTHVARNADSHVRRSEAAVRGEVIDQYPGGVAGRAAEIARGAERGAVDIVDDVVSSANRLDETWRRQPPMSWDGITRDTLGAERPLWALPARRWQELEVHAVDLEVGVTYRDWSDDFVTYWLTELRPDRDARLVDGARAPGPGALEPRVELAWLYGRLWRDDLPRLVPWH